MADEELETTSATVSAEQDAPVDLDAVEPGAGSSPAPEEGEKFDLLSVVRSAVATEAEDPASPAGQEQEADQPEADASAQNAETPPDDEDFSDAPFSRHPRFRQLIAQRNHFREGAKQYEQIQAFLQTNGLSAEEAADVLTVRALMKQNPAEAWKQLKPLVQQLLIDAGEILPADLRERVQRGEMSQAAATEFNRLRAAQSSGQRAQEMQSQIQAQQAEQARVASISQTVATWEQATRARDPDFDKKSEALQKEVLWLQRRDGMPKTADDARKMVEAAYASVTKQLAPKTQKQPVRPVVGGRSASGNPSAAPKSMLDVVQMSRAQG